MDRSRVRPAIVLTAMLAACGGENEASTTAANADNGALAKTSTGPDPGATYPRPFAADFMVGKWSAINEDCSATLEFREDGTVATPIGDARWSLAGDKLSFDYGDGSAPTVSIVRRLSDSRIELTHESGTRELEKRC